MKDSPCNPRFRHRPDRLWAARETTAPLRANWSRLLVWLPVLVFFVAIGVLSTADRPGYQEPICLAMVGGALGLLLVVRGVARLRVDCVVRFQSNADGGECEHSRLGTT